MGGTLQSHKVNAYDVQQLTFQYANRSGGKRNNAVLHALSFFIKSGEIFGVLGPNGSGKSTLLKLLIRVLKANQGTVQLFGQELQRLPQAEIARNVAYVPQETYQQFPFTVSEMVLMGRFPHHRGLWGFGWEGAEDLRVVDNAMRELDVTHLGTSFITDVSGGERQRAIIARALTQEPQVLLLDEPTAFLDLHHQIDIARILRRLNRDRGLTVVMVSHDLNLASQYCDRVMLLQNGKVAKIGSPHDVIRPEVLEPVYQCSVLIDQHPQTNVPRVTLPI